MLTWTRNMYRNYSMYVVVDNIKEKSLLRGITLEITWLQLKVVDFVYFCFLVCRKLTRPKLMVNQYWMQRNLFDFITCWQKDRKLMKYSWNMMMEKDFGHLQICVNSSIMNKRYRNFSFLLLVHFPFIS